MNTIMWVCVCVFVSCECVCVCERERVCVCHPDNVKFELFLNRIKSLRQYSQNFLL